MIISTDLVFWSGAFTLGVKGRKRTSCTKIAKNVQKTFLKVKMY